MPTGAKATPGSWLRGRLGLLGAPVILLINQHIPSSIQVYDGAGFLKDHPGGSHSITLVAGEDATEEFMAIHSSDAKKQLVDFHIGSLVGAPIPKIDKAEDDESMPFLNQTKWKTVRLVDVKAVSRDSKVYRFSLQQPDQDLGLPIGQHIYVRLRRKTGPKVIDDVGEGELVQRAYTPISKQDHRGFVDLLVKYVAAVTSVGTTPLISFYFL
jgi:nitrate reductase (NAD(P)H)